VLTYLAVAIADGAATIVDPGQRLITVIGKGTRAAAGPGVAGCVRVASAL
jgi:hypothetical protein